MMKISLLLLAILASAADAQIQNQVPACAYESGSTSCAAYADAMSGWNSNHNNILGTGICTAYTDGLCAEACTPQDMDGCSSYYNEGGGGGGGSGAICFAGDSLLTLEDGTTKTFHEIQVNTCSFLVDWSCFGSRLRSFNSFFYTVCLLLFICTRLCFCTRPGGR